MTTYEQRAPIPTRHRRARKGMLLQHLPRIDFPHPDSPRKRRGVPRIELGFGVRTQMGNHMTNSSDDFWTKQFVKHEAAPQTGKPVSKAVRPEPSPKPVNLEPQPAATAEDPQVLRMEKILLAGRSRNSKMSFEAFSSLVLSKVPAQTKAYWERWLFTWRAVLVERWRLSESPNAADDSAATKQV